MNPHMDAPAGALTVRSDAAWRMSDNTAGLGWCFLTPSSTMEFQKRMDYVSSPLMAEGLALRETIFSCRLLEQRVLRFESDSSQLIKSINTRIRAIELHSVVSDILYIYFW